MKEGLLELFEKLKKDFMGLSLEEFIVKVEAEGRRFDVWEAMNGTLIAQDWTPMQDSRVCPLLDFTKPLRYLVP